MRPASCVYWMTYLVPSLIAATLTTFQLRILRDVMEKLSAGIFRYAKKKKRPKSLFFSVLRKQLSVLSRLCGMPRAAVLIHVRQTAALSH